MKKEQKFKRGDLVKIVFGHPVANQAAIIDISRNEVSKQALIVGSHSDMYGGQNVNDYTVVFIETGEESSWKSEGQLDLVKKDCSHLFPEVEAKREAIFRENTNLELIVKNWIGARYITSFDTVLFLFEKIGFNSSFSRNGEYYALYSDWIKLGRIFDLLMTEKSDYDARKVLSANCPSDIQIKVVNFFKEVQAIKQVSLN